MQCALLFDIGNTNIKIGLADKNRVLEAYVLPTDDRHTGDSLGFAILEALRVARVDPDEVIFCLASSVVPALNPLLRRACGRFFNRDLLFVPEDLPIPLENRYASPTQVGADRLVGAFAARRLFPEPKSIICADYGTATTFDCLTDNAYLGGLICPGVLSSVSALASRTAKLPGVSLEVSEKTLAIGQSTSTSINHGFIFGFAAMSEGLCARLKTVLPGPVLTLATGGFAATLVKVSDCFDELRSDLLLEGLKILYSENS